MDMDKIKEIAYSNEGKKIQDMFKGSEIEQAAKSGDIESLKGAVSQLLQTDAGARLAKQISEMMKK
ncbi:MAG: hypothetical protein E7456_00360 [Ruminococcaceae bacterium]|nr:hypothetical protein [Oscillospiraceae bacterium]